MLCKLFFVSNCFCMFFFFCQIIVDVKWELQDQDTNMVYCFELPVQIV